MILKISNQYRILICTVLLMVFVLPAQQVSAMSAEEKAVWDAIASAEKARKAASAVGGEWRDVGKFLKAAENAAKGGDLAKAMKLAKKAKFQSEAGIAQSKLEAKVAKDLPDYMQ